MVELNDFLNLQMPQWKPIYNHCNQKAKGTPKEIENFK